MPQADKRCEAYMKKMNESDMHFVSNMVEHNSKSGIHITVESYQCDPRVMRDFDWTGTKHLEKTMSDNKEKAPEMGHQYIGTYSGLTRMYPSELENSEISSSNKNTTDEFWLTKTITSDFSKSNLIQNY